MALQRAVRAVCALSILSIVTAARFQFNDNEPHNVRPQWLSKAVVQYDEATEALSIANEDMFHSARLDESPAWGSYSPPKAHKSDFGQLRVTTSKAYSDKVQMQAAGYVEGYLTAEIIFDHWYNMQWWLSTQTNDTSRLITWLQHQDQWARQQIEMHRGTNDSFFQALELVMAQFDGLVQGYNVRISDMGEYPTIESLDTAAFLLLNAFGDIDDLMPMMEMKDLPLKQQHQHQHQHQQGTAGKGLLDPAWRGLSPGQMRARIAKMGRCTALIKVTPDLSDILMGHTTWWSYSSLLRIYKHISTQLQNPIVKSQRASFSSYPGLVSSMDDWYILDTQLVVTETSNNVYDLELYRQASNQAALSWQRVRVANMLATSGEEWAALAAQHNSGTYNNQYMVVDLKRFKPYQELQPGLLTVTEIIPGLAMVADTTQELERGYWPSYNTPYFIEVYNRTGYDLMKAHVAGLGGDFGGVVTGLSYQLASRAQIFRRDQGKVQDLAGLKHILRSMDWPSDQLTHSPWDTLCARGDLDTDAASADGCYDAKVTSYHLALEMTAEAINGPTYHPAGNSKLAPFSWSGFKHVAHRGMIETYRTEWEVQRP